MHKGYAFVQFTNPFDARNACHGEDGRTILSQVLGKCIVFYAIGIFYHRNHALSGSIYTLQLYPLPLPLIVIAVESTDKWNNAQKKWSEHGPRSKLQPAEMGIVSTFIIIMPLKIYIPTVSYSIS